MEIGGVDCILRAPIGAPVGDVILRLCRRMWPEGVFEDGEEEGYWPLQSPALLQRWAEREEFFVFRDQATAETWEDEGPTPKNWNHMLHFIILPIHEPEGNYTEVTVVVDEVTPEMRQFLENLQESFLNLESLCYSEAA